ncbi:MAG: response regulator [Oligoflexales bacterium]
MPKKENKRLVELAELAIIGSESDENYDQIAEFVADVCKAKIVLISFIDSDKQWVKSCFGVSIDKLSRSSSPCDQVVLGNEIIEVADCREDHRYHDNPLVHQDPSCFYYAGIPIKSANGYNVGTLCVMDNRPKSLSELQKKSLSISAKHVSHLLTLRTLKLRDGDRHKVEQALLDSAKYNHEISSRLTTLMLTFDLNIEKIPEKFYNTAMGVFDKISDNLKNIKFLAQEFVSPDEKNLSEEARLFDLVSTKEEKNILDSLLVLLVEDDNEQREFLAEVIDFKSSKNIKVTAVEDGRKAIEYIDSVEYDIIITDYDIPKIDGIGLVQACRSQGKNKATPIIFTTGGMPNIDTTKLLAQYPNLALLDKPFKIEQLIELMDAKLDA